jgi:hypothetical protein
VIFDFLMSIIAVDFWRFTRLEKISEQPRNVSYVEGKGAEASYGYSLLSWMGGRLNINVN